MKNRITKTLLPLLAICGLAISGCSQNQSNSATSSNSSTAENSTSTSKGDTSTSKPNTSSSSQESSSSSSEKKAITVAITGESKIKIDGTTTLTATVSNASDTSVTWSSLNAEIATVNAGVVTGVSVGEATIKATSSEDNTKFSTFVVTVIDKYDFRVTENKTYITEVENLDLSQFVVRGDGLASHPTAESCIEASDETTYGTSGGKSIGFIGQNTIISASFYSEKAFVLTPMVRMADAGATFDVDANIALTVDNSSVDSNGYKTFGGTESNQYWNWKDVSLDSLIVGVGAHTFTYKITGSQGINLDCFKFAVSDFNDTDKYYQIGENGTTIAEAENLDLTSFVVRGDVASVKPTAQDCIETSDTATYGTSGGKSLGFIGNGTVLKVNLFLKDEAVVTPEVRMASADSTFNVDGNSTFKVDDTVVDSNGYNAFGSNGSNTYYNWKDVNLDSVSLNAGFHTFTYTCTGSAINLDAFKFVTTYYGDIASSGYQINKNGTTLIEAEDIKVTSGSYKAEVPSGDALAATSGGKSIGNVAVGTVFTINFNLNDKATVKLVAVMAKAESDYSFDSNVAMSLDGKTLTPEAVTFGGIDGNTYWNWKDVVISNGILASGMHTLTLTATNVFPNMDCLKIITNGYGKTFYASESKTYRVEGEDVDKAHLVSDGGSSFTESSNEAAAATSGQSLLCHCAKGSYFEIPFSIVNAGSMNVTFRLSKYEALVIGDNYSAYVDGVKVSWSDPSFTLGRAADGSNDWHNWKLCTLPVQSLTSGDHTVKFSFDENGCNVDYIDFGFNF